MQKKVTYFVGLRAELIKNMYFMFLWHWSLEKKSAGIFKVIVIEEAKTLRKIFYGFDFWYLGVAFEVKNRNYAKICDILR